MAAPSLSATGSMYLVKFSRLCMARPPEMMILAEVSSGRSDFDSSSPTKDEMPGSAAAAAGLDRRRAALAGGLERGGAHRDHFLGVLRAHGLDRVAGIDQPLEGVGRDHLGDVGDLHHVEQRRDARHDVLGRRGRRPPRSRHRRARARRSAPRSAPPACARRRRRRRAAPWRRRRASRPRRPPRGSPCPRPAHGRRRRAPWRP